MPPFPFTSRPKRKRQDSVPIMGSIKPIRPLTSRHTSGFFSSQYPTKHSLKSNGIVRAYAATTSHGLVRNYNQDRVSIILNILKPLRRVNQTWPRCSFFGVYDGHGGSQCADFLRDNLHQFIVRNPNFPFNPREALIQGLRIAEKTFMERARLKDPIDKSGSCAVILLIVGEICYVANIGDSRAVMGGKFGEKIYSLTRDHKPHEVNQQARIVSNGGKVYQTVFEGQSKEVRGPFRVYPGRLSVSRAIGDLEAKDEALGGNSRVVVAEPDIRAFKYQSDFDFIVLASDGVFDKLSNREVVHSVWSSVFEAQESDIHKHAARAVNSVMQAATSRRTLDNITVVMVAFENFNKKLNIIKEKTSL